MQSLSLALLVVCAAVIGSVDAELRVSSVSPSAITTKCFKYQDDLKFDLLHKYCSSFLSTAAAGDARTYELQLEPCLCYYIQYSLAWYTMVPLSVRNMISELSDVAYEKSNGGWTFYGNKMDGKSEQDLAVAKIDAMNADIKLRANFDQIKSDCQLLIEQASYYIEKATRVEGNMEMVVAGIDDNFLGLLNAYTVCKNLK